MPFTVEDFVDEEREWLPKDFEEPEPPSKLEQANADLVELGKVLQERKEEQGPTIGPSERSPLQRLRTSDLGRAIAGPTREERAAMVAQQPSVADIGKTMLKFTTAPPQLTEPIAEATEPLISQLPPVAAGITRGVRDVAVGALGSLPAAALMPARLVAAPFAADYASTIPDQFQAIRESETPEQAAQALTATGLGGALTAAGTIQALRPQQRIAVEPQERPIVLEPERIPDARQIREAETVDGPLREQAIEVAQEVPAQVGGERISPPTGQAVQGEVLLAPPAPKPSPNEFVPALRRKEGETPIVGKQGQIHQDIYDAQGKMEGQKLRVEQPEHGFMRGNEFVTKEQLGNLLDEKGPVDSQRLRELQKSQPQAAPKTAVFNGIQMAGPSFKYFNEKTGRWNDVSAETAKQRGIEIPPEELAKAEAAQKGTSETTQTEGTVEAKPGVGETGEVRQEAGVGAQVPVRRSDVPEVAGESAADPTPSGQALGIVPPGSGKLMEIIDKAIGKPKEAGPPIKTETDTPFPDFQEHPVSKKIFSQPFGFENLPVIGALFGGTRRLKGHVNESLTTYWAERNIGRSIASAFGSEHTWLDKPFEIKDGQITNITPVKEGGSRYISDVFEALQKDPSSYRLNAEQQKAFDAVQKLEKDFSRLEEKHKIGKEVDNEGVDPSDLFDANVPQQKGPYFPRIVTSRPGGVTSGLTRGSSVGSKAFFEKPRMFETEAEGWAKGYKYEPSIVNRLATRAERLYKRIADKRLAEDPSLEGVGRKEVEAQLKASFAEELASGEMTEKKIAQMADSTEARGRVHPSAFLNKIFPEETAVQLNKAFPRSQGGLRQAAASVNNALKGLQLGLDLGVGFIQGQALLARHPAIWAKAQFNSLGALFHVEQFPKYVRENLEPVRELAQLGSGVGRLEEYMAGLGGKELLSKVPGVKGFGRQFQTFLDVAKVEMWKAFRETTPKEQWADVAQTLESVLSSGRMEAAGISQKRAMTERALFLAPSYYRGGLNMIAAMAEKGVSGQIARRAMVAYGTAGAVLFYGVAKQLGMSDDEINERMNPARSDFMMWRIKTKDRISNVGFGGFYRSLLRLMGNTAKTSLEHPENWASLSPDKNPITKWYRGHAGPVVTATWDAFSGKDYMGEDVDISTVARRAVTPITVQAARGRPGQPTPGATEMAGSFVGIQSYPVTSKSELNKLHSDWLANNPDPKVKADYERNRGKPREQSKYAGLITGLLDKDEKAVAGAIKELQGQGVKRSDIYKRFNPYTVSGEAQKPLFHESASTESVFKKSLTPEQLKLYDQARQDRKDQWKLFLKVYRENK